MSSIVLQFLNGLTSASTLFLVAAGLSLIFGITRVLNFAHGSMYMLGIYLAYSAIGAFAGGSAVTPAAFWGGVVVAAVLVGIFGALVELIVLRRVYRSPELFQLLATFGVVLLTKDLVLWLWGPEDLLGPRAPGLGGAVEIMGSPFPEYDLFLIVVGPLVLGVLWLLLHGTRWGLLIRAATQDREMAAALGINQKLLFTSTFALGAVLAGLGGALQIPREPAQHFLDFTVIVDAFVVVVVGGMGSIPGAFLAALLIGEVKALCIGIGQIGAFGLSVSLPKLTLVVESLVMAAVLIFRPWGLMGRPLAILAATAESKQTRLEEPGGWMTVVGIAVIAGLLLMPAVASEYSLVLMIDILIFALFASSLHFLMGPSGMASFGHAAYFGLGAYGAAMAFKHAGFPMEIALAGGPLIAATAALIFGWFCVRLSGVYLAMLTLAFAQITWSMVYQWDTVTGGSNGIVGVWPAPWLSGRVSYFYLVLLLCGAGILVIRRIVFSPFGFALRACRDSSLRAAAIGIHVSRFQWMAFLVAGGFAGLAGALFAFSKGSISPEVLAIGQSVDGLVMVLLGGVQTLSGPLVGATVFTWLQELVARHIDYWRAVLGLVILAIVIAFPKGIVGQLFSRKRTAS